VERVDLTQREEIVAVCRRAGVRQTIALLDLPLQSPPPAGAEWIEALHARFQPGAPTAAFASEARAILRELGFSDSDVDALVQAGATRETPPG
jgi:hypothetical protein